MSLQSTAWDKLKLWLDDEWSTLEGDFVHALNSFLEISKAIAANAEPKVWIILHHAFNKAYADAISLDFSDVLPDVLTTLAAEGIALGVDVSSQELEALHVLLTKGGTLNPSGMVKSIGLKVTASL